MKTYKASEELIEQRQYNKLIDEYVKAINAVSKKHNYTEMSVLTIVNVAAKLIPTSPVLFPIRAEAAVEYLYNQMFNNYLMLGDLKFNLEKKKPKKTDVIEIDYKDKNDSKVVTKLSSKKKTKPKAKPQTKAKPKALKKTK